MVSVFLTDAFDSFGSENLDEFVKELHKGEVETYQAGLDGKNVINSKKGIKSLVSKKKKDHTFTMFNNPTKRKQEMEKMAKSICTFKKE